VRSASTAAMKAAAPTSVGTAASAAMSTAAMLRKR